MKKRRKSEMKRSALTLIFLFASGLPLNAQHGHPAAPAEKPAVLLSGLGEQHHAVATRSAEAQKFFDQGFVLVYGFNHDEAVRAFRRAAALDPQMAMAYWGVAIALGPNYNETTVSPERMKGAHEAVQKGLALSAKGPEHERAYLEALAKRFSADPVADQRKLSLDYRDAMRELMRRYPDDLDAATLYADAAMIINAWKLWSPEGRPADGTEEIIRILETVLGREPTHIGANHLYIHAVEASPHPERAIQSADMLGKLSPSAGHLVHMPAHTYMRVGDYERAAQSNEWAANADRAYFEKQGPQGIYQLGYYSHNLHFLAAAHSMQGRYRDALRASALLEDNVQLFLKQAPPLESFLPTGLLIMTRFGRWDEVLKTKEPSRETPITNALWHWGRGMALAATGKTSEAQSEQKIFTSAVQMISPEMSYGSQNTARSVLKIAEHFLAARIARAGGDHKSAIAYLSKAVEAEDALAYDEPPGWYHPLSRETLGGALMLDKQYGEAERVFREDLRRNRRNGRSLFGLMESLKAQGKLHEAQLVRREFERAWKNADTQLKIEEL
jgi:tetratricopeptide (TPR) repeat protein